MDTLEKLRALDESPPIPPSLPTREEVESVQKKLNVQFPPSYEKYQLEYSNVTVGHIEMFWVFQDESYLDLVKSVGEARTNYGLDESLLPFAQEDEGDYYCFDLASHGPEFEVVYWSHDGKSEERWSNFLEWVEDCWIRDI